MKKLLKIVLTLILSVSLVACSSNDSSSDSTSSDVSTSTDSGTSDETTEATVGLEVIDYWYRYSVDDASVNYYVAVKNLNENQSFLYPGILVTSYDANDNELETFTESLGGGIASGDTIYFSSTFNYSQDFDSLVFEIVEDFGTASGYSDEAYPLSTDFDIVSTVEDHSITGTITNNGEYAVDTYNVVAIFKKDGNVIKASSDFPLASQFEILTYDVLDYDSYEVYCYAYLLMED